MIPLEAERPMIVRSKQANQQSILTVNAGSSSIKTALFRVCDQDRLHFVFRGEVEGIGRAPHFVARDATRSVLTDQSWADAGDFQRIVENLIAWVEGHLGAEQLTAVGHRVVHGGSDHDRPQRVTTALLATLDTLAPLAPLHELHNLAAIRAILAVRPELPQVACFDTAFHHTLPPVATRFALPREFMDSGIRRYGFHGLSYEYIVLRLREIAPEAAEGRVVAAHLGNGASLCAIRDGRSVDTTMGLTPLDGLVMGTRCGSLDPGVVLYLQQERGLTSEQVEDILYRQSGLLGVSGGVGNDMRTLLASSDMRAHEAIELFVFRAVREIGALASSLGGLETLVFTAGIGENAPEIRAMICDGLKWLGVQLDQKANVASDQLISKATSSVAVMVIATDEEAMIARHTIDVMQQAH